MRVRAKFHFNLFLCGLVYLVGCGLIGCETKGDVPAYVYIDAFTLSTGSGQGTDSEKITEGWFYANGEFLGAYSLPDVMAVLVEGTTDIQVFPGVRLNGIAATPDIYPFYRRFETTVDLVSGRVDTIRPQTEYLPTAQFRVLDDFEVTNAFIDDLDGDNGTRLEPQEFEVFEGTRSGHMQLTDDHPLIGVASLPIIEQLPFNASPVFIELNYKNDVEFGVGLVGNAPGFEQAPQVIIILRARDDWNKIYIELTETLLASQLPGYQIYFTAVHDPEREESNIFVDNVKLVQFTQ